MSFTDDELETLRDARDAIEGGERTSDILSDAVLLLRDILISGGNPTEAHGVEIFAADVMDRTISWMKGQTVDGTELADDWDELFQMAVVGSALAELEDDGGDDVAFY